MDSIFHIKITQNIKLKEYNNKKIKQITSIITSNTIFLNILSGCSKILKLIYQICIFEYDIEKIGNKIASR